MKRILTFLAVISLIVLTTSIANADSILTEKLMEDGTLRYEFPDGSRFFSTCENGEMDLMFVGLEFDAGVEYAVFREGEEYCPDLPDLIEESVLIADSGTYRINVTTGGNYYASVPNGAIVNDMFTLSTSPEHTVTLYVNDVVTQPSEDTDIAAYVSSRRQYRGRHSAARMCRCSE